MVLALWLQSTSDVSAKYLKWIAISVGIIALAFAVMAIGMMFFGLRALALLQDFKASFDEAKVKALPMIGNIYDITLTTQGILNDAAPKIKVITENVTETSHTVRQAVDHLDGTIRQTVDRAAVTFDDANFRTQRQVARVDSMVASTLAATAELGSTINQGIRVPARKIAEMMTQSKHLMDTFADRAKALAAGLTAYATHKPTPKPPSYPVDE